MFVSFDPIINENGVSIDLIVAFIEIQITIKY